MSLKDLQRGSQLSARSIRELARHVDLISPGSSPAAGSRLQSGAGQLAPASEWFPARIASVVTGGYTFAELWVDSTGTVVDKATGLTNSSNDPAVALDGATLNVGDIVIVRRGQGCAGLKWEVAAGSGGNGAFLARLTTSSSSKWKWYKLKLNTSGAYTDDGSESSAYNAVPCTIDGTNYSSPPVAGMRVWMKRSAGVDGSNNPQYEFLPVGGWNGSNTGASVGPGWVAGLATTHCLVATVLGASGMCSAISTTQDKPLTWNGGASKWESYDNFSYDGGSGKVRFFLTDGRPRCTINNVDLVLDDAGVDGSGNRYLDFSAGAALSTALCTAGTLAACGGNTFRIRITCAACADACCPAVVPPSALYLTITSTACAAINQVITLSLLPYYGSPGVYFWQASTGPCFGSRYVSITCVSGTYRLRISTVDQSAASGATFCLDVALTKASCDAMHLTYSENVNPISTGWVACCVYPHSCPNPTDVSVDIVE